MPFTDEFAAAPLNAGWTLIDPVGGTTLSVTNGALRWVSSANPTDMAPWKNDAARLVQPASGDFDINVDFGRNPGNLLDGCGLYVDDGTLNNFRAAYTYYDQNYSLGVQSVTNNDNGSLTNTRQNDLVASTGMGRYQRLTRTGNTLIWFVSANGTDWNQWWTGVWPGGSGQRVGLFIISDRQVTWDIPYFRFASAVTPATPAPSGTADGRIRMNGQWLQSNTRIRIDGAWKS